MSPRTFKSKEIEYKKSLNSQMKEELFENLARRVASYMENGAVNFDEWHHELCVYFIKEFAKILERAGKNPNDATYGKAQKIINMTFKYLYCFDDAEEYSERFKSCHMALDSYILNWVNDWFLDQFNEGKQRKDKLSKSGKRQLPKWSGLKYKAEKGDVPQYLEIQNAITERVQEEFGNSPIEAEFVIWYKQRSF